MAVYDHIGVGYTAVRGPDPRIEARIVAALAGAESILDVGAGTGSYEPPGRVLAAVEPSMQMIGQRAAGAAPAVRGVAEALPFPDRCFDAGLALLTVHHWTDAVAGLAELRRVVEGPIVVFTFDKAVHDRVWLTEYIPEMRDLDPDHLDSTAIADALGGGIVEVVPVPHDCLDGFAHAYWRRPSAYLDPAVRAGISSLARLPDEVVLPAVGRLRADIDDGTWSERHAELLDRDELDAGFRLVISP